MALVCFQMIHSLNLRLDNQPKSPQCMSKIELTQMLRRERRASISRPYFQHWRQNRDTNRRAPKLSLAFSPRLGKRAVEDENLIDNNQVNLNDLNNFLTAFLDYLQDNQIDIVYEDATKVCFSQAITDETLQQIFNDIEQNRRSIDDNEIFEPQSTGRNPLLFRYRLG